MIRRELRIDPKYSIRVTVSHPEMELPDISIEIVNAAGVPIPLDEPLMLFRARDTLSLEALREYRHFCYEAQCSEFQISATTERIEAFWKFAEQHPDRMKQPGITRGL